MAVLKRIGWFVLAVVLGIPFAVYTALLMAFGILMGTHAPYVRHDDGWSFGVERIDQ